MLAAEADKANNDCHSENRYTCYKTKQNVHDDFQYYKNEYINYHLYYGADSCIKDVLSSSALSYSVYVLLMILAFLF